ncbi:hypothetical protein GCM10007063_25390 [Lentibacillus kapialis]|uniref:Uncharacterized protein n=1 Tax=Lentibacillus kapialis TaxID=340214 RepID=A0A917PZ47_9BACI|nr:hypothetical protein [Lentibacillus kapialis]GGK02056.1 hypothetical protein GCM10007063_25390 [Lentibacillus kapialis]
MLKATGIVVSFVIGIVLVLVVILSIDSDSQQTSGDKLSQEDVEKGLDLQKNGGDGTYIVNLTSGKFEGKTKGQVLSDTNCAPDEDNISRCHNDIALADSNKEITVINPHNMQKNRCLTPGETVQISRNEDDKVAIELME